MKKTSKRAKSEVPPLPEEGLGALDDLGGLPAEAPLRPDEAAEAVGGARRLLAPVAPATPAATPESGGPAAPVAPLPWPPLRPDEKPS